MACASPFPPLRIVATVHHHIRSLSIDARVPRYGLVALRLALVVLALSTRDIVGIGRWSFRRPSGRVAVAQAVTAAADWILTASVPFAFIPAGTGIGAGELLRI